MEKRNVFETMEGRPPWHPVDFCEVNDVIIRTFVAEGQFPWHLHKKHEEFFLTMKRTFSTQNTRISSIFLSYFQYRNYLGQ